MQQTDRYHQIQRVFVITLFANLLVAAAKLVVGLLTRSLAMIADGFHSSLDAMSNVIGLVGSGLAARPPDTDHPYGHRRFETLASMIIGGVLLLTAWEIVKNSISRLAGSDIVPEIGVVNFAVMIVTILINVIVATYSTREGKRLRSELLLADAGHTRSDILVSFTVLAGLVTVKLGWAWMDAVAALVVVALIGWAAWRILRRSASILVDRAVLDAEAVSRVVRQVAGVKRVVRVRSRGPDDNVHLDLDVQIAAPVTAGHSAAIADEIRTQLREKFSGLTDIQVFFLPMQDGPLDYMLIARAEADALGVGVHEVIASSGAEGLTLEMHVEVPPAQAVSEAHKTASQLEARLKETIPGLRRIVTHIEPAHVVEQVPTKDPDAYILAGEALRIAQQLHPDGQWHDLDIRVEADGGYALSMHCYVSGDMAIEEAHRLAEDVETQIRSRLPAIHRVTIHTEPDKRG
jgi:cation diffusion facilitator family transporter